MNAKVSPAPSLESTPIATTGSAKNGPEALSLDFTRRSVADVLAQAAAKQAEEMPPLLDYQQWEAWYGGFVEEIASLPGM